MDTRPPNKGFVLCFALHDFADRFLDSSDDFNPAQDLVTQILNFLDRIEIPDDEVLVRDGKVYLTTLGYKLIDTIPPESEPLPGINRVPSSGRANDGGDNLRYIQEQTIVQPQMQRLTYLPGNAQSVYDTLPPPRRNQSLRNQNLQGDNQFMRQNGANSDEEDFLDKELRLLNEAAQTIQRAYKRYSTSDELPANSAEAADPSQQESLQRKKSISRLRLATLERANKSLDRNPGTANGGAGDIQSNAVQTTVVQPAKVEMIQYLNTLSRAYRDSQAPNFKDDFDSMLNSQTTFRYSLMMNNDYGDRRDDSDDDDVAIRNDSYRDYDHAKYGENVLNWMSRVARSPLPSHNSFISAIRNGDILCRLAAAMNVKAPECEYADEGDAYTIHKIIYFLESCRSAGVNEEDMFAITDLLSNGDDFTGIIRTLMAFDERARRLGFQGPPFPSPPPNIFNSLSPSAKPSAEPRYLENLPSSNRTSSNERYVEEKLIEQPKIQRFTFVQNQTLQRPAGGKNETLYSNNRPKSTGELKREHILQQIISSENLFVGDLLIAVKEFRKTRENPGGLSQADIVALFNNVEELYDIHQDLFKSFVSLPENASASVANILLDFLDPLSHAYLTFTTGTYATLNVLEKRVEDRELDKYLEDFIFSSDSNGISLESYLLRPLDRLEEYEKRLKDLSDVTPADSPSKRMILTAMAELHNVIEDIENQRKKMTTRRTATPSYLIPSVFAQFTDPDNLLNQRIDIQMLESEGRKFLCQGSVWEVINLNEVKVRSLLLFNDILVIAKELSDTNTGRFEVRQVIDLRNIVIRENREKSRKGLKLRPTVLSAVKKFNMNPNNAIDYLIMKRILEDNPGSVASFLHKTPGLSKRQVGKFIGSGENHEILVQYVKRFGSVFAGLRIDEALRLFLLCFRLPGDAQSLDRILKVFASHYYTMNSQYLTSEKAALKLVFSLIILNADLHNEAIPANRKMSLAEFIDKLRSTDPALTSLDPTVTIHLPTEMLRDMYDSIAEEKLAMGSDDDTSNSKLEIDIQSIPSKITIQETTDWVSVSIPSIDPYLKLKIYAQDILVDPPVLTFTKSPTQYCKFTGKSIGRKKVYLAPTGKSAGKYQYVIPQTIIVDPPYMKHTFSLEYSAQDKPNGNDLNGRSGSGTSYMFSVATEEQKERWISYVISALEDVRRR